MITLRHEIDGQGIKRGSLSCLFLEAGAAIFFMYSNILCSFCINTVFSLLISRQNRIVIVFKLYFDL